MSDELRRVLPYAGPRDPVEPPLVLWGDGRCARWIVGGMFVAIGIVNIALCVWSLLGGILLLTSRQEIFSNRDAAYMTAAPRQAGPSVGRSVEGTPHG
ncbi:MAG TPA: hypothetical protein VGN72_16365 [Tepidisphaeraceae bacterium]|jgi:hypothetical protein|nr:hypothetical protein [Tepidisphaeraceae bacterium]